MSMKQELRLDLVQEPVVEEKEKTKYLPKYKVLIHNDDTNSQIHVCKVLMQIFCFEPEKAIQVMKEAEKQGLAICAILSKEVAELRQQQLQSFSLTSTIEPE